MEWGLLSVLVMVSKKAHYSAKEGWGEKRQSS
jgi:hypothetical protein